MNLERAYKVVIREVTDDLPDLPDRWLCRDYSEPHAYKSGQWFYIELHVANFGCYGPCGMGTVQNVDEDGPLADLVSLFVLDCIRNQGCARMIIEAAGERWPNLAWIDTDESRQFHEGLIRDGIARKHGSHYEFIPKAERQSKK